MAKCFVDQGHQAFEFPENLRLENRITGPADSGVSGRRGLRELPWSLSNGSFPWRCTNPGFFEKNMQGSRSAPPLILLKALEECRA